MSTQPSSESQVMMMPDGHGEPYVVSRIAARHRTSATTSPATFTSASLTSEQARNTSGAFPIFSNLASTVRNDHDHYRPRLILFAGCFLHSGHSHSPSGSSLIPTHSQWNHWYWQLSLSQATMFPKLTLWQKQYFVSSPSSSSPSAPPIPVISSSSVPASLATLSSSAVVDGDVRDPPLRRFVFVTPALAARAIFRSGCCGFAFFTVNACLCGCLGPTLPAREPGVDGFGVPGPMEPCRESPDAAGGGRGPKLPVGRRRLPSLPVDISRS